MLPDGIFRESGEEKERLWTSSIMKVCSSGGEIEVRELVDLLGAHHKLSKDTIRTNVMSIVKDSAVVKKGVIKYIKGISPSK
jgi:predicted transcriptional regulator